MNRIRATEKWNAVLCLIFLLIIEFHLDFFQVEKLHFMGKSILLTYQHQLDSNM